MKITIHPHSTIDIITNSSTEIFSFNNEKTESEIKEIIKEQWNIFCEINRKNLSSEELDIDIVSTININKNGTCIIVSCYDCDVPVAFGNIVESLFNAYRSHS
ncbi:MAG: hypothetical protein WC755_08485 [Candidatus Woesearchaeota archaeon]|jgi:hypothetical protein